MNKAIFLDRDGTINVEKDYLYKIEDWEWIPKAIEAIKGFNDLGFYVIVVSNQSGIARGLYSKRNVDDLHNYVNEELKNSNAKIDEYYYCPHHPDFTGECNCRKPNIAMIEKAQNKYNINLKDSFFIGDRITDIETALNSNINPIFVLTGYGKEEVENLKYKVPVVKDIFEAYELIKRRIT
jgi:D,D-heptose 1,7-bisphosphate phosphatase